jgi:cell division protein ZapA
MATIKAIIRNTSHIINCDDGQEEHVKFLADKFNTKVQQLSQSQNHANELTLYLMAALIISDELEEYKTKLLNPKADINTDDSIAKALDMITEYVENIANKLEKC